MLWAGSNWEAQETRFIDGKLDFSHTVVYWFERYSDVILAKSILKNMQEDYSVLYDLALDQWVITSTYATESWK